METAIMAFSLTLWVNKVYPQDAMYRHHFSILIILGLFIGILGCYVESGSPPLAQTISTMPKNNIVVHQEPAPISFLGDYRQGLDVAKREAKLVLVFFTLPNSAVSQRMIETTFCDEEIKRLANRFVCIQIDGSKNEELCKSIDIKGFPTILFMNSQGEEIQRFAGKLTSDQLAIQMHVMIQNTASKIGSIIRK